MNQQTQQITILNPPIRLVPIEMCPGTLLTASNAVLYTVDTGDQVMLDTITICNTDTSSRTITLHLVPSGGSPSVANAIIYAVNIFANETKIIKPAAVLLAGYTVQAKASLTSVVSIRLDGSRIK